VGGKPVGDRHVRGILEGVAVDEDRGTVRRRSDRRRASGTGVKAMGSELAARPATAALEIVSGRYQVGREIGRGGKARVFLARDRLLRREVAVKVFRARAGDPEELRVQEAEAKLVASLNHFALTTLYDAGVDTSDPERPRIYLVMEYVAGGDLRERLRSGALSPLQAAYLGFDLAQGLEYLHDAGFLHRDIKPANVLLAVRGQDPRLHGKLADFGISSLIGAEGSSGSDSVTGTAAYLSPEQADGQDAGPESDIYSLGLVLLEAMTGRVAFPGDVTASALARLDRDPEVPVCVPEPLAGLLRRMTQRDRHRRAGLAEVMTGLQDYVVDHLVQQRDPLGSLRSPERARLEAVHRFNILDSPPEDAFDDVTELLCRSLRLPVALVAVVDEDRVWFKSHRGVPMSELPRTVFRDFTAPGGTAGRMVEDLRELPSMREHPFVAGEPFVRAAVAANLVTHDGQVIGCVLACDVVPRRFDAEEIATVEACTRIVMRELELRLASRRALFQN
jgi:serine/threonine protein kinase